MLGCIMKRKSVTRRGFTLVELLVVLVIVGILAAVIVRKYFDLGDAARQRAAKGAVSEGIARFRMAYEEYQLQTNGQRPTEDVAGFTTIMGYAPDTDVDIGDYVLRFHLGSGGTSDHVEIQAYRDDGSGASTGDMLASANATWPE
ncbi:hypothetical protein JCM12178A_19020 [Salidesulfovibrio brasiliensis]